jgi:hypothetical protein
VNGTEEPGFAEVLKQEGAKLLILHRPTLQVDIPVLRVPDTFRRPRRNAADLATDPAKAAPLIRRKRVSPAIHGDAGDRPRIEELLDIRADSKKGPGDANKLFAQVPFQLRPPLVDEKAHPIDIGENRPLQHAKGKIGIEERPSQKRAVFLLPKPGKKGLQAWDARRTARQCPPSPKPFLSFPSEPVEQILEMETGERQGNPFDRIVVYI